MAFSAFATRSAASSARREIAWPVNGSRIWWTLVEGGPAIRLRAIRNPPPPASASPAAIRSASIGLMSVLPLLFLFRPISPVGDDSHVDAGGQGAHQALRQGLAQAAPARAAAATRR